MLDSDPERNPLYKELDSWPVADVFDLNNRGRDESAAAVTLQNAALLLLLLLLWSRLHVSRLSEDLLNMTMLLLR